MTRIDIACEDVLGVDLSPEAVDALLSADDATVANFADRYLNVPTTQPVLGEQELCPYIPSSVNFIDLAANKGKLLLTLENTLDLGNLSTPTDPYSANPIFTRGLKSLLLYAHRVAIDDPISSVLARVDHVPIGLTRRSLASGVAALIEARPLIEANILILKPRDTHASPAPKLAVAEDQINRLAESLDPASSLSRLALPLTREVVERAIAGLGERLPDFPLAVVGSRLVDRESGVPIAEDDQDATWEVLVDAYIRTVVPSESWIRHCIQTIEMSHPTVHRHGFDFYFPWSYYVDVLRSLMGAGDAIAANTSSADTAVLAELLSVDLPDLDGLTMGDIVAVRAGASSFDRWRSGLELALRHAAASRQQGRDLDLKHIELELTEGKEKVLADIGQSATLSRVRKGLRGFTVGTAGALVAGAVAPAAVAGGMLTAAGEVLADQLLSAATYARAKKEQRSLYRHFLVFEGEN